MKRVLFVDARNSARSPMAVAWFNALNKNGSRSSSCGTMPARQVDPLAVKAMKEIGLNLRRHVPQAINQQIMANADIVVIMGPDVFPNALAPHYIWDLRDPTGKPLDEYRELRDAIRARVEKLIEEIERAERLQIQ